jgi:hypothetical protein
MSEKQETMHVIIRTPIAKGRLKRELSQPSKVFDDRADARAYAKRMNARPNTRFYFTVHPVKKG